MPFLRNVNVLAVGLANEQSRAEQYLTQKNTVEPTILGQQVT